MEAHRLAVGETVRTRDGSGARVLGLERLPGVHAVFNLEVEGLHQYHVSPLGLLAHNTDCREVNGGPKAVQGANEAVESGGDLAAIQKDATKPKPTHGHHTDPKFMGGDPNQKLTKMPVDQHQQLHKDLNEHLVNQTDAFGNHMRPQRGNPGAAIRRNFTDNQRRNAMADFYRINEAKYPEAAKDFFKMHPKRKKK